MYVHRVWSQLRAVLSLAIIKLSISFFNPKHKVGKFYCAVELRVKLRGLGVHVAHQLCIQSCVCPGCNLVTILYFHHSDLRSVIMIWPYICFQYCHCYTNQSNGIAFHMLLAALPTSDLYQRGSLPWRIKLNAVFLASTHKIITPGNTPGYQDFSSAENTPHNLLSKSRS